MRKKLPASAVRSGLSKAINQVAFGGERIILQRHGKDVAAVVSIEDLKFLEELEEQADIAAVRRARREKGAIPLAKVKKDLGL